jgi:hypothetical protein
MWGRIKANKIFNVEHLLMPVVINRDEEFALPVDDGPFCGLVGLGLLNGWRGQCLCWWHNRGMPKD